MLDGRINNRGTGGFHNYPKREPIPIGQRYCETCGIIEHGKIYNEVLAKHRGHNLCSWCPRRWKELEERLGRPIEFEEFRSGVGTHKKTQFKDFKSYGEIRKQAQEGKTVEELAVTFGVSKETIYRALS